MCLAALPLWTKISYHYLNISCWLNLLLCYRWLEECLPGVALPSAINLEAALQNGVVLAKLASFFSPTSISKRGIFDADEEIYKVFMRGDGRVEQNKLIFLKRQEMLYL